jgi:hypothetical protein
MGDVLLDEAEAAARAGALGALIDAWAPAGDERAWIARALRLDLPLIVEDPERVVACVHRRAAWLGADEEASFYDGTRAAPPEAAALRARMDRWAAIADARGPWLRSLCPPAVPLDAAVIEEYRAAARGAIAFADGDALIGVVEAPDDVWDRRSGRRVARVLPALPRAWRLGVDSSWGSVVLEDGARRVEVRIGDDAIARGLWPLSEELVLVRGENLDQEDFVLAIEPLAPRAPRVRWTFEGALEDAVVRDGSVFLVGGRRVTERDVATGEPRRAWHVGRAEWLALSAGGDLLATHSGAVIRVWELARAGHAPALAWRDRTTWDAAAFSPDGRRVLAHDHLCDGRTGASIARLSINGPGWLEGGPPRRARRLADDRFVEATPFGLTIWDSATGEEVRRERELRESGPDDVVYDPTSRWLVRARYRAPRAVEIVRADDGTELWRGCEGVEVVALEAGDGAAAWIADGGQLWLARVRGEDVDVRALATVDGARELALAVDASRVVVASRDTYVQLAADDGRVIATARAQQDYASQRRSLASLHGWAGLRMRAHDHDASIARGLLAVRGPSGERLAELPVDDEDVAGSPDGDRWAGPATHVALSGTAGPLGPAIAVRRGPGGDPDVAHAIVRRGDAVWIAVARGIRAIGPADHVATAVCDAIVASRARTPLEALAGASERLRALTDAVPVEVVDVGSPGSLIGWFRSVAVGIVAVIRDGEVALAYGGDVRAWRVRGGHGVSLLEDRPGEEPRILQVGSRRIALDFLGVAGARPPSARTIPLEPGDQLALDAAKVELADACIVVTVR